MWAKHGWFTGYMAFDQTLECFDDSGTMLTYGSVLKYIMQSLKKEIFFGFSWHFVKNEVVNVNKATFID